MTDEPEAQPIPEGHKSGFIAVVGRPNVGKSTLMNAILGEKIAIVSPKPQTTRIRQLGIYTRDDVQIIFVDTPGIHEARTKLGEFMVGVAVDALRDADLILFLVDVSAPPHEEDRRIVDLIQQAGNMTLMVLNKIDLANAEVLTANSEAFRALLPGAETITTSAKSGQGVNDVMERIITRLPEGPRYYPEDQLSDTAVRDIAAEIVREKVLLNLEEEVPHGVVTITEEFKERSAELTYIGVTVYVERDSHKGIVIGKGGKMLKTISQQSRIELEAFLGTKVYLELWVKVLKNWRKDETMLRRLGYRLSRDN
ncbi:MAG TPA: GTPase Era [Aggregatilineaceae bacterium]|nr:GTPase Era [Aggregatilineaceae bacterium]